MAESSIVKLLLEYYNVEDLSSVDGTEFLPVNKFWPCWNNNWDNFCATMLLLLN